MLTKNNQLNAGLRNRVSPASAFPNRVWERDARHGAPGVARAFTLVELLLVMALLVILLAFIAPSLRNSFRQRAVDQEAVRLLAVTEYARNEAVSQGIPTEVWIDPQHGAYGADAVPGYDNDKMDPTTTPTTGGNSAPITGVMAKEYSLPMDAHIEAPGAPHAASNGHSQMIQFDPDGTPTLSTAIDSVRIVDQDNRTSTLTLTTDGWGYEITKEGANATGQ